MSGGAIPLVNCWPYWSTFPDIVSDEPVYAVSRGNVGPADGTIEVLTPTALLKGKTL